MHYTIMNIKDNIKLVHETLANVATQHSSVEALRTAEQVLDNQHDITVDVLNEEFRVLKKHTIAQNIRLSSLNYLNEPANLDETVSSHDKGHVSVLQVEIDCTKLSICNGAQEMETVDKLCEEMQIIVTSQFQDIEKKCDEYEAAFTAAECEGRVIGHSEFSTQEAADNVLRSLIEQEAQIREVQERIRLKNEAELALVMALGQELDGLTSVEEQLDNDYESTNLALSNSDKRFTTAITRLDAINELVGVVSGVERVFHDGHNVIISLLNDIGDTLSLTLMLDQGTLINAKVEPCDLNISDLVAAGGDLACLVTSVLARWCDSGVLTSELLQLRQQFALDWVEKQQTVTVLLGHVTCILYVEPGYPHSGSVSLLSITGGHYSAVDGPGDGATLTAWLNYLKIICTA